MQDMLAAGEAWFEQQRREHLAVSVLYRPKSGLARDCRATLVTGRWESVDKAGNIVRMETRDFFIHYDELPQAPQRGDQIDVTENGSLRTYEVTIPGAESQAWRWSDRSERIRRIHTMAVSSTASPGSTTMFVRAIGASSAVAITDQQIKDQLTLDMASGRVLYAQLVAASQYVYIVLAASLGTPTIKINGIPSSAWEITTRSIQFTGQAERTYSIYRSTYAITGAPLVEVS